MVGRAGRAADCTAQTVSIWASCSRASRPLLTEVALADPWRLISDVGIERRAPAAKPGRLTLCPRLLTERREENASRGR
jgi:hypothetical protein